MSEKISCIKENLIIIKNKTPKVLPFAQLTVNSDLKQKNIKFFLPYTGLRSFEHL